MGVSRAEPERAPELRFRALPVEIAREPEQALHAVRLGEAVVERERAVHGPLRAGIRLHGHDGHPADDELSMAYAIAT